jgi:hypothetical protein
VPSDRARYEELKRGNYLAWRDRTTEHVEAAGLQAWLDRVPLAGAMFELGLRPSFCDLAESYLMNSSNCPSIIPPETCTPA